MKNDVQLLGRGRVQSCQLQQSLQSLPPASPLPSSVSFSQEHDAMIPKLPETEIFSFPFIDILSLQDIAIVPQERPKK